MEVLVRAKTEQLLDVSHVVDSMYVRCASLRGAEADNCADIEEGWLVARPGSSKGINNS